MKCYCRVNVNHTSIRLIPCLESRSLTRTRLIHPVLINLTVCDIQLFLLKWYDRNCQIFFLDKLKSFMPNQSDKWRTIITMITMVFPKSAFVPEISIFHLFNLSVEKRKCKWRIEFLRVDDSSLTASMESDEYTI